MSTVTTAPTKLTPDERSERLAYVLRSDTGSGWRVVSQTASSAQLVKGKQTSHLLHFILGLFTFGLWWLFVWLPVTIFGGEKQRYVAVDEYGNVQRS